jgi:hypothetical protein
MHVNITSGCGRRRSLTRTFCGEMCSRRCLAAPLCLLTCRPPRSAPRSDKLLMSGPDGVVLGRTSLGGARAACVSGKASLSWRWRSAGQPARRSRLDRVKALQAADCWLRACKPSATAPPAMPSHPTMAICTVCPSDKADHTRHRSAMQQTEPSEWCFALNQNSILFRLGNF